MTELKLATQAVPREGLGEVLVAKHKLSQVSLGTLRQKIDWRNHL